MNNELSYLLKNISQNNLDLFIKNTNPKLEINELTNDLVIDYSWISKIEKLLPYVEEIVENPKDFKILDEKNTNMFKEEFIDLYENRFIYALVNSLYNFITKEIALIEKKSLNKQEKVVKYKANTRYNNHDVKIDLKLECEDLALDAKKYAKYQEKIFYFKEMVEKLKTSNFMKSMTDSTPVRSPIRKTKTLTSENNYIKCLELWEFLEKYQYNEIMQNHIENSIVTNDNYENYFNLIYYLSYSLLNNQLSKNNDTINESNIVKNFLEYMKRYDVDEIDLKKTLEKEFANTIDYKKEQKKIVMDAYHSFIFEHENRMKKALLLFK